MSAANFTKCIVLTNIAKQYMETWLLDKHDPRASAIGRSILNKLNYIESTAYTETSEEGRKAMSNQLRQGDPLFFDSMFDIMLQLTDEKRNMLETI